MTYGHDDVIPVEINVESLRIQKQFWMETSDYTQAMMQELEDLDEVRAAALNKIVAQKQTVAWAYNKRVRNKSFEKGELVWKAILPLGSHLQGYGNGVRPGRTFYHSQSAWHGGIPIKEQGGSCTTTSS